MIICIVILIFNNLYLLVVKWWEAYEFAKDVLHAVRWGIIGVEFLYHTRLYYNE